MRVRRTPDARFASLPDFPYVPRYLTLTRSSENDLRLAYLDEGPRDAPTVLLMHGEPSWSFLYRFVIRDLLQLGFRVVAPDLIGFGRSDKPTRPEDYSYRRHVAWMSEWFEHMRFEGLVGFFQDWGGLIGLRLVAAYPDAFAGVVAANTFLPTGAKKPSAAFLKWRAYSQQVPVLPVGQIIQSGTVSHLPQSVIAAYDAPYPSEQYKAGARVFPALVPISRDDPEASANEAAWQVLRRFRKPFVTAFSDSDPVTRGLESVFHSLVPGCQGQDHVLVKNGGHFLQEDSPSQLVAVIAKLVKVVHGDESTKRSAKL